MRNGFRVIDTDCHQMEPPSIWADYIDPKFADRAPRVGEIGHGRKGVVVEGEALTRQTGSYPMDSEEFIAATVRAMQRFERTRNAGFSPQSRLEDMDEQGVDAQVIYPTAGGQLLGKPFEDTELLAACCRAYNDWSLRILLDRAPTTAMAAMLPMQAVDLAIEEARRAACAWRAPPSTCVRIPIGGRNLHHRDYEPLWREIAQPR